MVRSRFINGIRHMRRQCKQAAGRQYSCSSSSSSSSFGGVSREKTDCVVIGGGVVGIAVARELALAGRQVLLLEAASSIGTVTSSRNSQVIHAGIYYSPQSLKARLCVKGRKMLYEYCALHGVPHRQLGKLIVATSASQNHALEKLLRVGLKNGVADLRLMERVEAMRMEPELHCIKALWSPSTGIIDSHSFMLALQGEAEEHGTTFAFNTTVVRGHINQNVPEDGGLGVHATLDLSGQVRFGPDVEWMPEIDDTTCFLNMFEYTIDDRRAQLFYPKIRNYYPKLKDGTLRPDYSGLRPKLSGHGQPAADFVIQGKETHGIPGLVNLFGIESPGLTASMAIAGMVSAIV